MERRRRRRGGQRRSLEQENVEICREGGGRGGEGKAASSPSLAPSQSLPFGDNLRMVSLPSI